MFDIDTALAGLRAMPADPRLAEIDGAVLDGIAAHRARRSALRAPALGLAACGALVAGIVGAALPAAPARADDGLLLGTPAALSPSSLLNIAQ